MESKRVFRGSHVFLNMFLQIDMSKFGDFPSFVRPKNHRFFRLNRTSLVGKLDLKQFIFEK